MRTYAVQRNLEASGMSAVRESVTLLNCLQEPDCEAVSLLFVAMLHYLCARCAARSRTLLRSFCPCVSPRKN